MSEIERATDDEVQGLRLASLIERTRPRRQEQLEAMLSAKGRSEADPKRLSERAKQRAVEGRAEGVPERVALDAVEPHSNAPRMLESRGEREPTEEPPRPHASHRRLAAEGRELGDRERVAASEERINRIEGEAHRQHPASDEIETRIHDDAAAHERLRAARSTERIVEPRPSGELDARPEAHAAAGWLDDVALRWERAKAARARVEAPAQTHAREQVTAKPVGRG